MGFFASIFSNALLFSLVVGMSATVEMEHMKRQIRNIHALMTGLLLQFIIIPFFGFLVVNALGLSSPMGITLLVITSSPGGSYSNWWCSMFNADLALSVTMTGLSTVLSTIMLPINLAIYATTTFDSEVVKNLDWDDLFISLVVVIGGIGTGLFCSYRFSSKRFNLMANKAGNIAGVLLIMTSFALSSSGHDTSLWNRPAKFYFGVASPCILGLVVANLMTTYFKLKKPERVTVSVECCYQNTGIATSVAIAMFSGDELAEAIGVPLFYGIVEAAVLGCYCLGAWKNGWTKAPADENLCVVILSSYEVEEAYRSEPAAFEVVMGSEKAISDKEAANGNNAPRDLIFQYDRQEGYTIDHATAMALAQQTPTSSGTNNIEAGTETNGVPIVPTTSALPSEQDAETLPIEGRTID
mmetsp:Transcript_23081/g.35370  ORF Transcript_23081/g.35370 Transcript_23081/m.35370 type:complete len:412 (+) Transcript_23081:170-1405(+)